MNSPYTAVKPVYDRKAKSYKAEVVEGADLHLVHFGYMVYDFAGPALEAVRAGRLIGSWKAGHKAAVVAHLEAKLAG